MITKIDAAKSQMATAIWLYFSDRDPVSVHTLATAASEISDVLCKIKGVQTFRAGFLAAVKPEYQKEVADNLNGPRNFFKHASSKGPDEMLEKFSDDWNYNMIWWGSESILKIDAEFWEGSFFRLWVSIIKPDLFVTNPDRQDMLDKVFKDADKQPRAAQKAMALDAMHLAAKPGLITVRESVLG